MGRRLTRREAARLKQEVLDKLNDLGLANVIDGAPRWDDVGREAIYVQTNVFIHPFDGSDQAPYVEITFMPGETDVTLEVMSGIAMEMQNFFEIAFFFTTRSHAVYGRRG